MMTEQELQEIERRADDRDIDHGASLRALIAPAGTLWIFDTEGLHRGVYKDENREMLHVNVTPGALPFSDAPYPADFLNGAPPHVAGMMSRAVSR